MTTVAKVWNTAKQECLDLGMTPTVDNAKSLIKRGGTSVRTMQNYVDRKDVTDIRQKPYTNEFGEQEAFGDICERNLEYAEQFVRKNMKKFQGGVKNMNVASLYIIQKQREQLDNLKGTEGAKPYFKSSRKS